MYKILYGNETIVTQQFNEYAAISGVLSEKLNTSSILTFTLPPQHFAVPLLNGRNGLVKLFNDNKLLFAGDIVNRSTDFSSSTTFECQDAIGWMNDIVLVKPTFTGTISAYWSYLITAYNAQASAWRQVRAGNVTVTGNVTVNYASEFPSVFQLISSLINSRGGYVSVRYEGEWIYLDYLSTAAAAVEQPIMFGMNLLDLDDYISEEEIFSRVYPRGNDGLDISSVNDGVPYIVNSTIEASYGKVAVCVDFDTNNAATLKSLGQAYFSGNGFGTRTLTVVAFDMSLVNNTYDEIRLGANVKARSQKHGIDTVIQVNARSLDIVSPQRSTFNLGLQQKVLSSIVSSKSGGSGTGSASVQYVLSGLDGAVRYDAAQNLSTAQKNQARANIGLTDAYINSLINAKLNALNGNGVAY